MKIQDIVTWRSAVHLSRPYTIALQTITDVDLFFIRIQTDTGIVGLGSASPAPEVTDETAEICAAALESDAVAWLKGRDPRHLGGLCRELRRRLIDAPAARVALEMALHDIVARHLAIPLVDLFGRCHEALPTSVTIGIQPTDEALTTARDFLAQGFRCLKIKIGRDFDAEVDLLGRLRAEVGPAIRIRVDANRGYGVQEAERLWPLVRELDLELVEQPVRVRSFAQVRSLPEDYRRLVAADESLLDEEDALSLVQEPRACGIFNIKLMKCGGLTSALTIAGFAEAAGIDLMWGCMDESAISIAAALHTAYACPNTRYLDLDGSFELVTDPARGGFTVSDGLMKLTDGIGLGVSLRP